MLNTHHCIAGLLALLGVVTLTAQQSGPLTPKFTHWGMEHGLPPGEGRALAEDPRGYIWVGTNAGIAKFDGSTWTTFSPGSGPQNVVDGRISGLLFVDTTYLYIATEGGLNRMDLRTETIERLPNVLPDGRRMERTECVETLRDGRILTCYEMLTPSLGGVGLFDPETGTWENFLYDADHNTGGMHAIEDPTEDGVVWMGGWGNITRLDTRTGAFELLSPPGFSRGNFLYHDLEVLNDTTLIIPRFGTGLFKLNTRSREWTRWGQAFRPLTLARLDSNRWVAACDQQGLALFDMRTEEARIYPMAKGTPYAMAEDDADHVIVDREGRIWVGHDDGVSVLDPHWQQFETTVFAPINGNPMDLRLGNLAEHPTEGKIVVGVPYPDGFYVVDEQSKAILDTVDTYTGGPWKGEHFKTYFLDFINPDTLVFTNYQGVFGMDWNTREMFLIRRRNDPVFDGNLLIQMVVMEDGRLAMGSRKSMLYLIDPATAEVEAVNLDDRPDVYRSTVVGHSLDEQGRVWVASHTVVGRYDPVTKAFTRLEDLVPSWEPKSEGRIVKFLPMGDSLLFVTTQVQGLIRYDLQDGSRKRVYLPGEEAYWGNRMVTDDQHNIWVGTNRGLLQYNPITERSTLYDRQSGMAWSDMIKAGLVVSRSGALWTTAREFLVKMDLQHFRPNTELPRCELQSIRINGFPLQTDRIVSMVDTLELTPGQDQLSFNLSALAFTNPDQVTYAYRLVGQHDDWREVGTEAYGNYLGLGDGEYTLEVRAANANGEWGPTKQVAVLVAPRFYQTWWFLLLMVGIGVAIVWVVSQFRAQQARDKAELQAEFEKKLAEVEMSALRAQMNPHFLFNCLNSIKYFIIQNRVEEAADYLTKFSRLIRLILNNSKTELVPLGAEMDALDLYIQMERLRFQDQFSYNIDLPDDLPKDEVTVPPLLVQPFVENAIWHGLMHRETPGHLSIQVSRQGRMIEVTVQDNGVGREKAAELRSKQSVKRKSLGMDITKDRVETINQLYNSNARIAVEDLFENGSPSGTRVVIQIPLN